MSEHAYRPRIQWMQGTEVRHITAMDLPSIDDIADFADDVAEAVSLNGVCTFETPRGDFFMVRAQAITEVHYQRVQMDPARQRNTLPARTPGATLEHCCTPGSPFRSDAGTPGATLQHKCCADHWSSCTYGEAAQDTDPDTADVTPQRECCASDTCTCREDTPPDATELGYVSPFQAPGHGGPCLPMAETVGPMHPMALSLAQCPSWPSECTCGSYPAGTVIDGLTIQTYPKRGDGDGA